MVIDMSKYTTEVRWLCEYEASQEVGSKVDGIEKIDNILTISAPKIFNFDFPIFDENYRLLLERKILRHFYTREIGEETVGLWKLRMWDRLNTIMPYYNKLYESELLTFNPLYDVDLRKEHEGSSSGSNESLEKNNYQSVSNEDKNRNDNTTGSKQNVSDMNSTSVTNNSNSETNINNEESTHWNLFSDTPQGGVYLIDNTDPESAVAGKAYLTNATKDTNSDSASGVRKNEENGNKNDVGHSTGSENIDSSTNAKEVNMYSNTGVNNKNLVGNIQNTENYIDHVFGKQGHHTYSAMLLEFRKTLLNIDAMILKDLEDLFFGLW